MKPYTSIPHARTASPAGSARTLRTKSGKVAPLLAAGGALALFATIAAIPAAAAETTLSEVDRQAVVLVDFRNRTLADPQQTHDQAVRNFFGPTDSLASYYAENSHGRMSVVPAEGDGVFGPITLDMDDTAACDTDKIAELARKAVPDVDYNHISIVLRSNYCSDWWGLANMPGDVSWFHEAAVADKAALVHEIGHNLGLDHQERQICTADNFTACTDDGYSNRTPMGGGGAKKGLTAPELQSLKWLTAQQVTTPTATTTVRLTPLHATGTSGVRAIDLPLGSGGDRIVVEYRTPDSATPDIDIAQGVNVYRISGGRYSDAVMISNVKRDDKSAAGSLVADTSLADTSAHVSIRVSQATAAGADVHIQLGSGTGPRPAATPPAPVPAKSAPAKSTQHADNPADIGSAITSPPAQPSTRAGSSLAATGASALGPAVIGVVLVTAGATATVLLGRRRTRKH
ncbi:hypothetical protein ABZ478_19945 [Streptomyces sp. NPDC005706]|uniref:hypothetical protein n=1 Tax=Streptomyces sp. NPDC005706 TaxID=3157169 RepID=UPI0033E0A517